MVWKNFKTSVLVLVVLSVLTGVMYPMAVTLFARFLFPAKAEGSLIQRNGTVVGSALIGQPFRSPKYFWSRPSATSPYEYNAASSVGSNLGPLNPALLESAEKRIHDLRVVDSPNTQPIPVDLVTASGSGLDPNISVAAALYQLPRVARYRGMSEEKLRVLVDRFTDGRQFGILGEARVNVLELNLALDEGGSILEEHE